MACLCFWPRLVRLRLYEVFNWKFNEIEIVDNLISLRIFKVTFWRRKNIQELGVSDSGIIECITIYWLIFCMRVYVVVPLLFSTSYTYDLQITNGRKCYFNMSLEIIYDCFQCCINFYTNDFEFHTKNDVKFEMITM